MSLETLLQRADLWRGGEAPSAAGRVLPSGFPALDALLPGGGWPCRGLTEILVPGEGTGTLSLLMPALAALSRAGGWLAWVMPPHLPYAPALAGHGLALERVLWIRARDPRQGLWGLEQLLRAGLSEGGTPAAADAVLAWPTRLDMTDLRRLQLAAEAGGSWGLLFRPTAAAGTPTPAALRLRVTPAADGVTVEVLKRRGGWPAGPLRLAL